MKCQTSYKKNFDVLESKSSCFIKLDPFLFYSLNILLKFISCLRRLQPINDKKEWNPKDTIF